MGSIHFLGNFTLAKVKMLSHTFMVESLICDMEIKKDSKGFCILQEN